MAAKRTPGQQREVNELLTPDHWLNRAILFGLDGHAVKCTPGPSESPARRSAISPLGVAMDISDFTR
jgi:hypothetical protein